MDRLIFVSKEDSVADALTALTQNRILSVPVYDEDGNMYVMPVSAQYPAYKMILSLVLQVCWVCRRARFGRILR